VDNVYLNKMTLVCIRVTLRYGKSIIQLQVFGCLARRRSCRNCRCWWQIGYRWSNVTWARDNN